MFCPSVEKNHIQKEDALRCNQAMIEVDVGVGGLSFSLIFTMFL